MQQSITEAGALYPIAIAEASNNTTAKGEDRYVLHKGVMWRHPRTGAVPVATNFPRFESVEIGLWCHGDPMQTRWFQMQFVADVTD
jgi:hypothetical protein